MISRMEIEDHDPQYTGTFLPAEIMELLWAGTLTSTEVILLATIDAFAKRKMGCFASNEYLAKKIGVEHPVSVSRMLGKLKRLKLIKIKDANGGPNKRRIKTRWTPPTIRHDGT